MPKLTSEEYTKHNGYICPNCGSDNIAGEGIDIIGDEAQQACMCCDCGANWTAIYSLTSYIDLMA